MYGNSSAALPDQWQDGRRTTSQRRDAADRSACSCGTSGFVRAVAAQREAERREQVAARGRLRAAQRARAALWAQVAAGRHPGDALAVSDAMRAADDAVIWAGLDVERLAPVPA